MLFSSGRTPWIAAGLLAVLVHIGAPLHPAQAANLTEIAELIAHPEQYDHQDVVVSGKVTNLQLATNRQGQPAYGFLLQDQAGTLKIISLGQAEVREGDQVIVKASSTACGKSAAPLSITKSKPFRSSP